MFQGSIVKHRKQKDSAGDRVLYPVHSQSCWATSLLGKRDEEACLALARRISLPVQLLNPWRRDYYAQLLGSHWAIESRKLGLPTQCHETRVLLSTLWAWSWPFPGWVSRETTAPTNADDCLGTWWRGCHAGMPYVSPTAAWRGAQKQRIGLAGLRSCVWSQNCPNGINQ